MEEGKELLKLQSELFNLCLYLRKFRIKSGILFVGAPFAVLCECHSLRIITNNTLNKTFIQCPVKLLLLEL
jgi:hypothetical protein